MCIRDRYGAALLLKATPIGKSPPASGIHGEPLGFCKRLNYYSILPGAPCLAFWRHGIRETQPSDLGDRRIFDIPIPGLKVQTWGTQSPSASQTWATRQTPMDNLQGLLARNCARLPSIGQEGKGCENRVSQRVELETQPPKRFH